MKLTHAPKTLTEYGFDHIMLSAFVFVIFGIIGTAFLVASHAATPSLQWKGLLEPFSGNSGYCLTASGAIPGKSTAELQKCSTTPDNNQTWSLYDIKLANVDGAKSVQEFYLKNGAGNVCLDDYGHKTTKMFPAKLYTCSKTNTAVTFIWGKKFAVHKYSTNQLANVASGTTFAKALCLDDDYGSKAQNNPVGLFPCKKTTKSNQEWFEHTAPTVSGGSGGSSGTGGGSDSSCTKPSYSSSDAEATDNTDPNDGYQYWWVNNDAWSGSAGPQTIYVCSQSSWYVVSDQTDNGGQVETYPDTEYDVSGRDNGSTKTISQWNTITGSFTEDFPTEGSWDAGFDLWTNDWTNETMIWNQWAGSQDYWYQQATTTVSLGGVPYKFIDNGGELIFMRENQVQSGSVNILAAWDWEVANGYAKASDKPTQMEYGVEICATNGPETFPVTGVSFTVQ